MTLVYTGSVILYIGTGVNVGDGVLNYIESRFGTLMSQFVSAMHIFAVVL